MCYMDIPEGIARSNFVCDRVKPCGEEWLYTNPSVVMTLSLRLHRRFGILKKKKTVRKIEKGEQ